jgi:hypothetical protein
VAESIIKKVVVAKKDLPAFSAENNSYSVRYRIVSEDKNRFSHWSPYYSVTRQTSPTVPCSVTVLDGVVTMVWKQPVDHNIKEFDIYFKIDSGSFAYVSTVSSTQFSTLIDQSATSITAVIQLSTYPKQYLQSAVIFTSALITI